MCTVGDRPAVTTRRQWAQKQIENKEGDHRLMIPLSSFLQLMTDVW
jgi:hypothetical protein